MATMAGKDGSFSVGASAVGYIDNWSLTINQGTSEASELGTAAKEFVATSTDWSGNASGSLDPSDAQQKAAITAISGGTGAPLAIEFGVSTTVKFAGNAILTSVQIGAAHGDKVTFSMNFQGTGALTPTLPS